MTRDRTVLPPKSFGRKPPQYWRWLLAPMLLLSLGLHGLVLFTPVAPSEEDLVPPPDPEEDGIAITKIDAPNTSVAASTVSTPQSTRGTVKTNPPTNQSPVSSNPARNPSNNSPGRSPQSNQGGGTGGGGSGTENTLGVPPLPADQRAGNPILDTPQVQPPGVSDSTSTSANSSTGGSNSSGGSDLFKEYFEVYEGYRGQTITEADAVSFKESWLSSFANKGAAYSGLEVQELNDFENVPYDAGVCLPYTPTPAQILVVVEADGELNTDRQLVQTTGYISFNQAAQKILRDRQDYPTASTPQAYLAEIAVDYDEENCQQPEDVADLPDEYSALLGDYDPQFTNINEAEATRDAWLESLMASGTVKLSESTEPSNASPSEAETEQAEVETEQAEAESTETTEEATDLPETETPETPETQQSETDELEIPELEGFDSEIEYALDLCLPIAPKDAWWGVVVNPDGTLEGEPEALRSTGYSIFDERSKELIEDYDFSESETIQAYVVKVPVDYNDVNCKLPTEMAAQSEAASTSDSEPQADSGDETTAQNTQDTVAFNPDRQEQLIETGRQNVESSSLGSLNSDPELAALSVDSGWPEDIDKSCFLSESDAESGLIPVEAAEDAVVLSQNTDAASGAIANLYDVSAEDAGEYCDAPLYELTEEGTPQLFASVVGFGAGDSNTLVVIWSSDPRQESEETSNPQDSESSEDSQNSDEPESSPEPESPQETEETPTQNPRGLG